VSKVVKRKYLLLDFFFGFVIALDLFGALTPFIALAPFVDPFVADLDPSFTAADLAPFVAVAAFHPFGATFNPFVLASSAALLAKSSCLLEHPVFSKIRLMVGEVSSSSMVAREVGLTVAD